MIKNLIINIKEKIINVVEKLFVFMGFLGILLRVIVWEVDVNLVVIYYYFGFKEELFIVVVKRVV